MEKYSEAKLQTAFTHFAQALFLQSQLNSSPIPAFFWAPFKSELKPKLGPTWPKEHQVLFIFSAFSFSSHVNSSPCALQLCSSTTAKLSLAHEELFLHSNASTCSSMNVLFPHAAQAIPSSTSSRHTHLFCCLPTAHAPSSAACQQAFHAKANCSRETSPIYGYKSHAKERMGLASCWQGLANRRKKGRKKETNLGQEERDKERRKSATWRGKEKES